MFTNLTIKNKFLALSLIPIVLLLVLSYAKFNQNKLENAFKKRLDDIQQNSINNFEWGEQDWQNYHNNQLKRLPIFTQKYFYDCVDHALKDLHDNHSQLLKKHYFDTPVQAEALKPDSFSVKIEEGIGIINFPTLITEVNERDAMLSENWVIEVHKEIEHAAQNVTKGWIIDLTRNNGGNMYPMLAALSYFYNERILGGFASNIKNKRETVFVSFDGQLFRIYSQDLSFDYQDLSYTTKLEVHQNRLPVIVLIGKNTASSGEFVALALKRQKNATLIGQASQGLATGNEIMQLPDNLGSYALAGSYYLNVNNQPLLEKKVEPSIILSTDENMIDYAKRLIKTKQIH